jgi:hypothetical protein
MTAAGLSLAIHFPWRARTPALILMVVCWFWTALPALTEPLTLKHAVELALAHSPLAGRPTLMSNGRLPPCKRRATSTFRR